MNYKFLALAAGASILAISAGTPAKAITYYLTGSDTYACDGASGTVCTITYNNFGLDFTAPGTWSALTTGPIGSIAITNDSNVDSLTFFQDLTTIDNTGSGSRVGFTVGPDNFFLSLTSPVDGTPSNSTTTASLFSTSFTSSTLNADSSPETLTGTGSITAVPFASSVLALLPLGIFSRKLKIRNLSV